jgi:hypothetical protein
VRLAFALGILAACSRSDGGGGLTSPAPAPASAAPVKGTGFSASLSAELAKEGSGSAGASNSGSAGGSVAAGGSAIEIPKPGADDVPKNVPKATATTKTAETKQVEPKVAEPKPQVAVAARPSDHHGPVPVPADLAAIKLDLEPNWDRDFDEAGTISFVLKVPPGNDTRLFSFHYGYDPAGAPVDRDAYKKWLADQKILTPTLDRQRGAAWYLEGTDGNNAPAFRYRVTYGGKQLVCWGSLYKDAASNPLGDLRDKVVMAAKKICETLTL